MVGKKERLAYTEEAKKIIAEMTLKEKLSLVGGKSSMLKMAMDFMGPGYNHKPYHAAGCKRLGISDMRFCDGPRGVVSGSSTCFPVAMLRGATFDPELEERVGRVIGREVRANGGNYFGGICINIPYHPAWGRSQESYGEDTVHMAKMAVSLVKGVQSKNVMACAKHFAFNSMENSRFKVNVTCSKRTEREIYLSHFKKCVDAGVSSIMGAYNKYQGEYCCENSYLLKKVLREDWDFDGFIITDFCFGIHDTEKAAKSGIDIEMCNTDKFKPKKLMKLIKEGKFTEKQLDEIALHIIRTIIAYSKAKDDEVITKSMIACKDHISIAREVAEKGITLLKNEQILPFDKNVKKIVVVGDLANIENIGDHGSSHIKHAPYNVTFIRSLEQNYSQVQFKHVLTSKVKENTNIIKEADKVIIFAGYKHNDEGEYVNPRGKTNGRFGGDRQALGLHEEEVEMIRNITALNSKTVVVLIGGNMIRVSEWIDHVSGVLMAFYPGMEGGNAIADIIFGKVNPSGKLPYVTVKNDEDLPKVKWDTEEQYYDFYHGFHKTDKENIVTQFPYGYGLSYSQFDINNFEFCGIVDDKAKFSINVKNTGKMEGAEVPQLYVGYKNSNVERHVKTLVDFHKIILKPGETKKVELFANKEDISYFDEKKNSFILEEIDYIAYVGNNSDDAMKRSLEFKFN